MRDFRTILCQLSESRRSFVRIDHHRLRKTAFPGDLGGSAQGFAMTEINNAVTNSAARQQFYRFHLRHVHLASVFGDDWFALKAEAF
jgi:hypothetical protein